MPKRKVDEISSGDADGFAAKNLRETIAVQACDTCRKKKARCDEDYPICGTCRRSATDCHWSDRRITKKDQTLQIAINSVKRLEAKIDSLTEIVIQSQTERSSSSVAVQKSLVDTPTVQDTPPTSPLPHKIISFSQHGVLLWPAIRNALPPSVLGLLDGLPRNYAVELERSRTPLPTTTSLFPESMSKEWLNNLPVRVVRGLTDAFFSTFNGLYPVLDRRHFFSVTLGRALDSEFDCSIECTTVLLVLALGCLAVEGHREGDYSLQRDRSSRDAFNPPDWDASICGEKYPGLTFFNEARKRMGFRIGSNSLYDAQVYLLCGFYYTQIIRPMDSYLMLEHAALCSLTTLTCSEPVDWSTWEGDMESRVFWCALMYETILCQELGLPKSGLSDFEAQVPLPTFRAFVTSGPNDSARPESDDDEFFFHYHFLAQAANRIMLTRIANTHYYYDGNAKLPSTRVHEELLHQIEQWRSSLPAQLQFDSGPMARPIDPGHAVAEALMRSRYKVIIFHLGRPYLHKALHHPSQLTDDDLAVCRATWRSAMDWPMLTGLCKLMKSCMLLKFGWASQGFGQLVMMWCFANAADHRLRETIPPGFDLWAEEIIDLLEYSAVHSPAIAKDLELLHCLHKSA